MSLAATVSIREDVQAPVTGFLTGVIWSVPELVMTILLVEDV